MACFYYIIIINTLFFAVNLIYFMYLDCFKEFCMKKKKRILGIKNPDALDVVLAVIVGIITAGALWLGFWISMNNAYTISHQSWQNFVDSFTLQFEHFYSWQGLLSSAVIYLGGVAGIVLIFASLIKKSFRGVMGAINVALCAVSGSLFFNFLIGFSNPIKTKISGNKRK